MEFCDKDLPTWAQQYAGAKHFHSKKGINGVIATKC